MADEQSSLLPSEAMHYRADQHGSSTYVRSRHQTKRFLTSKVGHYAVLALVSLDISTIFADLLLTSLACEGRIPLHGAEKASDVLSIVRYEVLRRYLRHQ